MLDPVTGLHYRGARVFRAVVEDLMAKGLKNAQNVLLAGGSSGGLGVMVHCDRMSGDDSPSSPSHVNQALDDMRLAIQNLALEIRTSRQDHQALAQRVDALFEPRGFNPPTPRGGFHIPPTGPRRHPPGFPPEGAHDALTPKVRFDAPKFNGSDPAGWVFKVQSYFDYFRTPEDVRLRLVGLLFESPASDWFLYQYNNNCITMWPAFLEAVKQRFDPSHYEDYMGLLCKLQQRTSVIDYQAEFERLLNKITGVPEATLVSIYVAGLRQPTRREVLLRRPVTLGQTFALARELAANYTDTLAALSGPSKRAWNSPGASTSGAVSTRGHDTTAKTNLGVSSAPNSTIPVRRFSAAERADRTAKGLCWNCDEKYVPGHKCAHRFLSLLDSTTDAPEESAGPEEEDEIFLSGDVSSINTLSGSISPRALKVVGTITGNPVQILIDGGSTHSFIQPSVVERLSLNTAPVTPFRVYVGNGESLPCRLMCESVGLEIQSYSFSVDLYVLQIHGPDIVLGIQWLQGLGKIGHDYGALTMEFRAGDRIITFRGDGPANRRISYNAMQALIHSEELVSGFELEFQALSADQDRPTAGEFPADIPAPFGQFLRAIVQSSSNPLHYAQPLPTILHQICTENDTDPDLVELHAAASTGTLPAPYIIHDGVLYYHHRICLGKNSALKSPILTEFHASPSAGHPGVERTFRRVAGVFFWPHMRRDVRAFVEACSTSTPSISTLPSEFHEGAPLSVPQRAVDTRKVLVQGALQEQWLVVWSDGSLVDATWEPVDYLKTQYPDLVLEDKDALVGEADDTAQQGGELVEPNNRMGIEVPNYNNNNNPVESHNSRGFDRLPPKVSEESQVRPANVVVHAAVVQGQGERVRDLERIERRVQKEKRRFDVPNQVSGEETRPRPHFRNAPSGQRVVRTVQAHDVAEDVVKEHRTPGVSDAEEERAVGETLHSHTLREKAPEAVAVHHDAETAGRTPGEEDVAGTSEPFRHQLLDDCPENPRPPVVQARGGVRLLDIAGERPPVTGPHHHTIPIVKIRIMGVRRQKMKPREIVGLHVARRTNVGFRPVGTALNGTTGNLMPGGVHTPASALDENDPVRRPCTAFSGVPFVSRRAAVKANSALGYSAGKGTDDRGDIDCVMEEQQQHNRENYFEERERGGVFCCHTVLASSVIMDGGELAKASR
ncbi:unnamed protein product [Cuscuta campestris]|uniref:Retrotransposon gag domain-containing protein n=1 Tax=Cuscuta campestris TaxID=132261 RepID=A0A484MCH1_9ASTE|nr:unnamed protein product [Cuscuta campestris]